MDDARDEDGLIVGNPLTNPSAFLLSEIQAIKRAQGLPVAVPPLAVVESNIVNPSLVGGYGQTLQNLFGGKTRNVTVGVAIAFPFKNKTAEANLAGARIQKEQLMASTRAQEQLIEVDVRNWTFDVRLTPHFSNISPFLRYEHLIRGPRRSPGGLP